MITRSAVDEQFLADVVTRITGVLHPWRIILFGSRARGGATHDSDYDFYVELNVTDAESLRSAQGVIQQVLPRPGVWVDIKVAALGDLERRRDDPGAIEWDVAREGRVLYSATGATPLLTRSTRVREPGPPESLAEWLQLAEKDLQHRNDLWKLDRGYWAEICWLSHQTAEKHLKALLVSRNVRPERTHQLLVLADQLERVGVALSGIRSACDLLNGHAVAPRYGPGLLLQREDARLATEAADRVIAAVQPYLGV